GPDGGSPGKPVGLVHMAVAISNKHIETTIFHFSGPRSIIKLRAALAGIDFLRRVIIKNKI
ncbi:MAG TPA: CinA family protein, partial [bacterium]|nr:CinA family protein [bacterium]